MFDCQSSISKHIGGTTKEEIIEIEKEHLANLGARVGQKALAYEVTKVIHGKEKADEALQMSQVLFSGDIKSLNKKQLEEVFGDLTVEVEGEKILEDLLIEIKAASSKREAREFIKNNSISINGEKVNDALKVISKSDALYNEYTLVKRGKKNYYLVKHI